MITSISANDSDLFQRVDSQKDYSRGLERFQFPHHGLYYNTARWQTSFQSYRLDSVGWELLTALLPSLQSTNKQLVYHTMRTFSYFLPSPMLIYSHLQSDQNRCVTGELAYWQNSSNSRRPSTRKVLRWGSTTPKSRQTNHINQLSGKGRLHVAYLYFNSNTMSNNPKQQRL